MMFLDKVYNLIDIATQWLWGLPVLILLIGGGLILSGIINNIQFTHIKKIYKSTFGAPKGDNSDGEISPVQGMIAALAATVGTGNIVGVGAAIAIGGPGALFWVWVAGFLAMGIKYSEVTMSCNFRESDGEGGYKGGPFMYIKNGLNNGPLAVFFGIMMLICLTVICGVHGSSISSNLGLLGIPKYVSAIIMIAFVVSIIWGGMKGLVKITDKLVPLMTFTYIILSIIIIICNLNKIGPVFASIFAGAFNGWAAVGGFAGAAFSSTLRIGLARGVFSNDAGLGLSASVQAQVKNIGHPAKQGCWAIIETFIDTIIICTLSGLIILVTGVWEAGGDGSTFATEAASNVFGKTGSIVVIVSLFLFGLSSLLTDAQGVKIQAISMFNSPKLGSVFQVGIILLIIIGSMTDIKKAFLLVDFSNAIILFVNVISLILLGKTLRKLTREWFDSGVEQKN